MEVNYDVWGSPEDWQNISSSTWVTQAGCKIPKSGRTSYYNAYNAGALIGGEVPTDLSLAFWGIGKGSILAHPMYLSSYWDGDNIKTAVNEVETPSTVPCILNWTTDPSSTQADMMWSYRYAPTDNPGESNWNVINLLGNTAAARTLIASYNYQNIFLIPYVKVAKAETTSWSTAIISLKAYIDSMLESGTYSSYDKVISIGYQIAIGDGISNNRSTGLKELGIVFPVSFEGSQRSYNDGSRTYTWYATRYGIDALMTNLALNSYTHSLAPYYEWAAENFSNLHLVGDADTGWRRKYCKNYYAGGNVYGQVPIYYYNPDDDIWKINDSLPWNTSYAYPFPYIECTQTTADTVKDYILKQIAFLGFPFMYDPTLAARGQIGDTGVFLPEFNDAGITTGEYAEGRAALRLPNSEWIDGRTGSGYDPYTPEGGDLDNVTGRNLNFWSSNKYYLMRQYDLDKFLAAVNGLYTGGNTAEEKAEELRKMQVDFKGSNPSDYIVGLYGIPFQWPGGYQAFQPVMLGPVEVLPNDSESDTAVELLNPDFNIEMLFGEIEIPKLGNFLDYEPYTTLMLYVPFCGTCKLDAAEYIGHTVRVVGTLDKHTGELAVRIIRDRLTVTNTLTGNLYVRVPVTSQAMGTYETNLHQLQMAAFNREFGLLTNAVTGGVSMGAAASAGGEGEGAGSGGMISPTAPISMAASLIQLPIAMADYDFRITHCQPPVFYSSSASSANQAKFYRKAKLFIKRPVFLDTYSTEIGKYVYAHTVGYACCKQVEHINDMATAEHDHLIKCSNVDLTGIPATADELAAIKKALTQGIYI